MHSWQSIAFDEEARECEDATCRSNVGFIHGYLFEGGSADRHIRFQFLGSPLSAAVLRKECTSDCGGNEGIPTERQGLFGGARRVEESAMDKRANLRN